MYFRNWWLLDSVNKKIIRVITNQWYYCRRCPPAARSLCSIPGSITRPKQICPTIVCSMTAKQKYAFPVKQLMTWQKHAPTQLSPPFYYSKKNAAGYVSIAVLKPCQIKKGLKYIWAPPKMVSFSATNCKKKTPYLLQLKYIFGFCYLTALTLTTLMPCPSAGPKGVWTCTKKFGLNQKF